jgi:hypothetical protein
VPEAQGRAVVSGSDCYSTLLLISLKQTKAPKNVLIDSPYVRKTSKRLKKNVNTQAVL